MSDRAPPAKAEVVIIGGGALGLSTAWALTELGRPDVVVLEKAAITHGSTWHAAGLVGQYRSRPDLARLMRTSVEILDRLEGETPLGYRKVGSLRIASSAARWAEYHEAERKARASGLAFELVSAVEARRRFPYLALEGVEGAAFVHGDGYIDPMSLANAYAVRARAGGVRIVEGVTVRSIERERRGFALTTGEGRIACRTLVLAPGVWARPVGRMLGLDLAVAALEHQYAVTEKMPDMPRDLPALRDPDHNFYLKPETGGFAVGGWEAETVPVHGSDMPWSFGRELLPDNLERLQPILEAAIRRLPILGRLGLRQIINGPIPVTPDGEPILGPAPGLADVWLAVGFTSGIAASAGAGRTLAEWIVQGRPEHPVPSLDPARFAAIEHDMTAVNARAVAAYASYYALAAARSAHHRA